MTDVRMPDGTVVRFPDSMPRDQIKALIQTKYPDTAAPQAAPASDVTALPAEAGAGTMLSTAGSNLIPSAKKFGADMASIVTDPVGTGKNLYNVGKGAIQKLIPGEQGGEKYADAVGQYFADRYGGWDNIKKTMAEDPVGFLADVSTVLSGGSLAGARAPGLIGTVSRAAGTAGRVVDPINAGLKAAKLTGAGVGKVAAGVSGLMTGAGSDAVKTAAKAGFAGGDTARTFRENMRGAVPMEDVIGQAKSALQNIKNDRQAAYVAGMAELGQDQTVLDFSKIEAALNATKPVKEFKGISLQPSAAATAKEIATVLDEWKKLPAEEFHTPEGFDALKQRLGDIASEAKPGSASQKLGTQVYNIVKAQIVAQAPKYAQTMADYQKASELIKEIEGTLSLNRNARVDTQLRKLQSVMRNNVNTNYGKRADLVKLLEAKGAKNIMTALAGQAMSTLDPRGLARVVAGLGTAAGGTAALSMLDPSILTATLAQLALQSPRLAGEAVFFGGKAAKKASKVPLRGSLQTGYQARERERTRSQ